MIVSPGLMDRSSRMMMPEMKFETTFCRPKPMPTPIAPDSTVKTVRSTPIPAMATSDCDHDQADPQYLADQHAQRRGQLLGTLNAVVEEVADGRPQPTARRRGTRRL